MSPPNDWEIRKCLVLCSSLLLAVLVVVEVGNLGFDLPVLRQLVGFLFLAFVPGILLLRILKIHNISIIESLLYTVGLSIAFVMVVGVILNFTLPPLGASRPIAIFPLITAVTIAILVLGIVAYKRDKTYTPTSSPSDKGKGKTKVRLGVVLNPILLAVLLPLLAILGASLVNWYQNNTLLLVLIFTIVIILALVAFNKFIPPQVYPFLIFMIAISLLYQTTLISNYLVGSDIHLEYYYAKLIAGSGYWDASIANSINSCLSIVVMAPVYSLLLNMDIVWLFKIIYPLFFCLMPLALYRVFRFQIGPRYAFLATFFFIAMPMFFMDMPQLARQQVSELFFVLVVLLMVERKLTLIQRTILVIIFGFGVIVSYYGLGTGYAIGYLTLGSLVLIFIKSRPGRTVWQWIVGKYNSLPDDLASVGAFNKKALAIIVSVSLVFMFAYYGVVASGAGLSGSRIATDVVETTVSTITTPPPGGTKPPTGTITLPVEPPVFIQNLISRFPFLNPLSKEPLVQTAIGLDFPVASPGGKIWRILQYLVELCLVVGFFRLIFRPATLGKLKAEYISLVIVSAIILLGIFILPGRSYGMGVTRIWQITLLLVSPLYIFGGETIALGIMKLFGACGKRFASLRTRLDYQALIWFPVVVILIPYFIFNTGVIFELSRSQTTHFINMPYSVSLSSYRLDLNTVFTKQDIIATEWLSKVGEENEPVYVDYHSYRLLMYQVEFPCRVTEVAYNTKKIYSPSYFYLRAWNIQKNVLTFATSYGARQSIGFDDLPWFRQIWETAGRIYNNGGAQVLVISR